MIFQVDEWVLDNNGNTMQCVLSSQVASRISSIYSQSVSKEIKGIIASYSQRTVNGQRAVLAE
jgi:hypothetical protein